MFCLRSVQLNVISLKLKELHHSEETLLFFHLETAQGIFKNSVLLSNYIKKHFSLK